MPQSPVPLLPLRSLEPDQMADCFAQLTERHRRHTHEGKPYYACGFRDVGRKVSLMVWSDSPWFAACARDWREGQIYLLRCTYALNERYGHQIELFNIRPAMTADLEAGLDLGQVIESSRFDVEVMFADLLQLVEREIAHGGLRELVRTILVRHADVLKQLPASDKFHVFRGGWLEHVLSVTKTALWLADHYRAHYPEARPPLNRDLIVAAAVLHDAGRAVEWTAELGQAIPTVPGKLFGHLILGRDLVRDAAREVGNVEPELVQLLEHVVLTHLTLPEWGSPRLPLVPEVLILHHADDLDAKMEMYQKVLRRDQNPGPFTARDPVLGKQLLKGRTL